MTAIIAVAELTKQFGDFTAVNHVSFDVMPGEIFGYLGPNGSGKTTTMRMLLGLLQPTSGRAQIFGLDSAAQTERIRPRVGYMSQRFALYEDLTVGENLTFYGGVYGLSGPDLLKRRADVLALIGLSERERDMARDLAGGWRQRLALGIALVHKPALLFLDEPTSGVDPEARRAFWDLIYGLAAEGTTVFVSTHYMDEAEHCGRLGIMNQGRLLALDTPSTLKSTVVKGEAFDIEAADLLGAIDVIGAMPGVERVGLLGDHLHVIAERGHDSAADLRGALASFPDVRVSPAEVTLDDVFMVLAGR